MVRKGGIAVVRRRETSALVRAINGGGNESPCRMVKCRRVHCHDIYDDGETGWKNRHPGSCCGSQPGCFFSVGLVRIAPLTGRIAIQFGEFCGSQVFDGNQIIPITADFFHCQANRLVILQAAQVFDVLQ